LRYDAEIKVELVGRTMGRKAVSGNPPGIEKCLALLEFYY